MTTRDPNDESASFVVIMHYLLPGVSMIELGSLYKIIVVDTPIDDHSTWRYMLHARPGVGLGAVGDLLQ